MRCEYVNLITPAMVSIRNFDNSQKLGGSGSCLQIISCRRDSFKLLKMDNKNFVWVCLIPQWSEFTLNISKHSTFKSE
jgi:hypothetical protein